MRSVWPWFIAGSLLGLVGVGGVVYSAGRVLARPTGSLRAPRPPPAAAAAAQAGAPTRQGPPPAPGAAVGSAKKSAP